MAGVSVLIPTRNRANLLERAIKSALAQTHRPLEILISNNRSSDGTSSVIQMFEAETIDGVKVRGYTQERDIGAVSNHGFLLEKATYEYCCFVHDDDYLLDPKFFSEAVRTLQTTQDCLLCVGNTIVQRENSVVGEMSKELVLRLPGYTRQGWEIVDGTDFSFALNWRVGFPSYSGIVFDREAARKHGAYRPPFAIEETQSSKHGFTQEEGLCILYLLAVGRKIGYTSRPVSVRTVHVQQDSQQPEVARSVFASLLLLWSSVHDALIRERRASPVRIRRWFLTMLFHHVRIKYDRPTFQALFSERPGVTLLHIALQTIADVATSARRYRRRCARLTRRGFRAARSGELSSRITKQGVRGLRGLLATVFPPR